MILCVGEDFGHVFDRLGELLLPGIRIGHDMRNMAAVGPGCVGLTCDVEIYVSGAAGRVVGPQDRLEGLVAGTRQGHWPARLTIAFGIICAPGGFLILWVLFASYRLGQPWEDERPSQTDGRN